MSPEANPARDLVAGRSTFLVLWGLPLLVIAVTGAWPLDADKRAIAWAASFSVAGLACLANARRSGRVHCYLTGPYFLGLAGLTLLYTYAGVPFGATGWWLIATALVIGTPLMWIIPERRRGRYGERADGCC
jgi:hypothetical protein